MSSDSPASPALERVHVAVGDLTRPDPSWDVDAIVNAANESLLGGAGVDSAIHRAAGPSLLEHNRTLGGCPTGLAKRTPAFDLQSQGIRHILHTVGPVWPFDNDRPDAKLSDLLEDVLLASCYVNVMKLTAELGCRGVAFPAISTGVYRFPRARAARIALGHVLGHYQQRPAPDLPGHAIFVCFNDEDARAYHEAIATIDRWMFNRKRA
jgi:O-acetyl-ADP-ribose deacetylase (regulator of RNase III)